MAKKESTALAVQDITVRELGAICVKSGFFEDTEQEAQAIVKILAGREAGLQPIESMTGIHIIKGKISFGANMMASAVKKHPNYDYRVITHTEKECVIDFFEIIYDLKDRIPRKEKIGQSSFTMTEADKILHWDKKKAKDVTLSSGAQWKNYPKAMLFARALSAGVRYYCPDVFGHSPVYVPEELGANVDGDGEPINITPKNAELLKLVDDAYAQGTPIKKPIINKQCKCGNVLPDCNETGICAMCMGGSEPNVTLVVKPPKAVLDSLDDDEWDGTDYTDEDREEPEPVEEPAPKKRGRPKKKEIEPEIPESIYQADDNQEQETPDTSTDPEDILPGREQTSEPPKSEDGLQLPPSIITKVSDAENARQAFEIIEEYAFDGQGHHFKALVKEYCPEYFEKGYALFQIPESAIIVMVHKATCVRFKKSEDTPTCKAKGCKNKLTAPESKEHGGKCTDHFIPKEDE